MCAETKSRGFFLWLRIGKSFSLSCKQNFYPPERCVGVGLGNRREFRRKSTSNHFHPLSIRLLVRVFVAFPHCVILFWLKSSGAESFRFSSLFSPINFETFWFFTFFLQPRWETSAVDWTWAKDFPPSLLFAFEKLFLLSHKPRPSRWKFRNLEPEWRGGGEGKKDGNQQIRHKLCVGVKEDFIYAFIILFHPPINTSAQNPYIRHFIINLMCNSWNMCGTKSFAFPKKLNVQISISGPEFDEDFSSTIKFCLLVCWPYLRLGAK